MSFGFRIRFHLVDGDRINIAEEEIELLASAGGPTVRLCAGQTGVRIRDLSRVVLAGKPYPTVEEAAGAASYHRERLLAVATRRRLALDLGDGLIRQRLTPEGAVEWERRYGRKPRSDVHGTDIYELPPGDGKVPFVNIDIQSSITIEGKTLVDEFHLALRDPKPFDERELRAAEVSATARFIPSFRARFLVLMSALEALIEPEPRSPNVIALVNEFQARVKSLPDNAAPPSDRESIHSSLEWLKQESIGQAGRRLAREVEPTQYLDRPAVQFFSYIYSLRSQILHAGATKNSEVDLLALANATGDFLADLLRGRVERRTGRTGEIPRVIEAVTGHIDPNGGGVTVPAPYKPPERPKP